MRICAPVVLVQRPGGVVVEFLLYVHAIVHFQFDGIVLLLAGFLRGGDDFLLQLRRALNLLH